MSRPIASLLFAALVSTTALAGCFQPNPQSEEATYSISRAYSILINTETSRQMEGADGPEDFVRRFVDSSLVVRVGDAGDFTLAYTDEDGRQRSESLTGLSPGTARTVEGVDPFTAATLTRADAVVATRGPVTKDWWHIGEIPVGAHAAAPASAAYDFTAFSSLELELEDIQSEDGNMTLDTLLARLSLPVKGELTWNLAPESGEDRIEIKGDVEVDDTRGSLLLVDAKGTFDGEAIEMGAELVSGAASADGGVAMWIKDGKITSGQFLGGAARADPKAYAWATGLPEDAQGDFSCAGKSRAERCEPQELESFDESEPAGTREDVPADEFTVESDEDREAFRLLEKLFAQDLGLFDSLTLTAEFSSEDSGDEASDYSMRYVQDLSVAAKESVQVPAGTFDAFRIVQSARVVVDADHITQSSCEEYGDYPDYGCARWSNGTIVEDLHIDETLLRTTLWLHSTTFQPLKGELTAPIDLGAVIRRALGSVGDQFWSEMQIEAFDPNDLRLAAKSESTFSARSLSGDARFAPYVGLLIGSVMAGGFGGGFNGLAAPSLLSPWMMGMGTGYATPAYPEPYPYEPYPTPPPGDYPYMTPSTPGGYYTYPTPPTAEPRRSMSLSLTSAGPIADGAKTYTVAAVSEGVSWGDVSMSVDGYHRGLAYEGDCTGGEDYEFVACNGDVLLTYSEMVEAGHTVRLPAVESGQTLRVIDAWTNSVVMTLVIG